MNSETKNCQSCKNQFLIETEDFNFYERIKVPPPKWCPDCRQQRRYSWRNERVLYRRNCDLCGKSTVTIYSPNKPYKVFCPPCWWSDKWNAADYARDFDFSKPFFEQWQELQLQVPRIALLVKNSVDSEYTNHSSDNKNCFYSFSIMYSENLFYCTNVWKTSKDCFDCYLARSAGGAELAYECIDSYNIYRCQYGVLLRDCNDCLYCYDLRGCSNCFLSSNLRNKQYYFLNKPYSKEDYLKKVAEFRLGSHADRTKLYGEWLDLIKDKSVHRFAVIEKSANVSGNMITNSKNAHHVFDADGTEDCKYGVICPDVKNSMDSYHYGLQCELIYETHAIIHSYNVHFTHLSYDNSNIMYCDSCHNSENLFGCVGLKSARYAILNKSYSDGEYETLKEKVVEHMKKTGEYGEFFPPSISPFGYNETQGQIYMPLTKEEALARGYKWENQIPGTFGKGTIEMAKVPDDIRDVPDSITKEALTCAECKKNYNVVRDEINFYKRMDIPIPRLCPNCRYARRIALRPPRKLWQRQCMCDKKHSHHPENRCPNEFETSYAPDRKEIVYCEQCYNAEVV